MVAYSEGENLTTYEYTADNLRAAKTVNGVRTDYVWNGSNMAYEHNADISNTYAYDITGVHMSNSDVYLKDGHGNVLGKHGTTTGTADVNYDAFGNILYDSVQPTPFGYCGEYYDNESGLIYLRNRYYDSTTGRFITEDPIQNGVNWYSYCGGNPVSFVDPWGLDVYYFVNSEFKKEAEKDQEKLADFYDEPVHILEVDTREAFIEEWNKMGSWAGEDVEVSLVVINMHGSPSGLSPHADGSNGKIKVSDVENGTLISKYIDNILVLGCNSGHFDHRYSSLVNKLLVYNNVDSVIASDGTVTNRSIFGNYTSKGDASFVSYLWSGQKYRDNFGFIKYTKNDNGELEWDVLGKKFTITSLLTKAGIEKEQ